MNKIIYQVTIEGPQIIFRRLLKHFQEHGFSKTFRAIYQKLSDHVPIVKKQKGFCPCCEQNVTFISNHHWLREHYLCNNCWCIPRERALMYVIEQVLPNYKDLIVHESSPADRGASVRLKRDCKHYIGSHYFPDTQDSTVNEFRNIDLHKQNFDDNIFDLVVTQDVFEHLPYPEQAIKEICRTLKQGGYLIATAPLENKFMPTQQWAVLENNEIKFLYTPEYHGNPIDANGSPVFFHYGYDIAHLFDQWAPMCTILMQIEKPEYGIEAEYLEIIVSKKL